MKSNFKNIEKNCLCCGTKLKLNNNRDIERKKFCSKECNGSYLLTNLWKNDNFAKKITENSSKPNLKKGHKGKNHPKWIEDRTKLKGKRCLYEEKQFFNDVLNERNYTCEITLEKCSKLSVHHLDSVSLFPDKKFDKDNVIVIKLDIHKDFHNKYGYNNIKKEHWIDYINSVDFKK